MNTNVPEIKAAAFIIGVCKCLRSAASQKLRCADQGRVSLYIFNQERHMLYAKTK